MYPGMEVRICSPSLYQLQKTEAEDGGNGLSEVLLGPTQSAHQQVSVGAHLTLGGERRLLVPQRKPTTFPRGTILIFRLAGGDVGVATTSRGSAVGRRPRQEIRFQTRQSSDPVVSQRVMMIKSTAEILRVTVAEVTALRTVLPHEGLSSFAESESSPWITDPLLILASYKHNILSNDTSAET